MKLAIALDREELNSLYTQVVVEQWNKRTFGKVKRVWLKEFNEKERKKASRLYPMFYDWYLVKGVPQRHIFMPETLTLTKRLVQFFGTI